MASAGAQAASGSAGPADSYIGSLISLTSKSEIRYEGVLYNINTEESSIGLRNVRSFGTEGRKKDGQQVLPSDKVYEYILFRGSDIKDLQVKSSPPVPTPAPIHNDPAIIQSHYSRPPALSTSLPAAASGPVADPSSQMGLPRSTFQGGLPLYQPGGGLGSWGPSPPPPSANGGALPVPMYWQGFYPPHMQQQSLLRPPPGLSVPHPNILQYTGMSASLPTGTSNAPASMFPSSLSEFPPPLFPPVSSAAMNLPSSSMASTLSSTLAPAQTAAVASETSSSLMPNMAPSATLPTVTPSSSLSLVSPMATSNLDINVVTSSASNKLMAIPGASLPYQTMSRSISSSAGTSSSSHPEASTPSLVTPDQLLQPGSTTLPSLQSSKPLHKDVEVVPSYSEEPLPSAKTDVQVPILPLPTAPSQKLNGPPSLTRHNQNFRGRQRGRGSMIRNATQFTEDFDFIAMNEKFNKDEVWGDLGKNHKQGSGDEDDEDYLDDEDYSGAPKLEKPVYVKDDFFDSLSSNALDHASGNGRTKFSEQRKIDTETFGEFSRYRGGRGGRGPFRGGRSRGPHYGRGYGYGYGYGYAGRGRGQGQGQGQGQTMSNRFN